jgi:hypothetical protein
MHYRRFRLATRGRSVRTDRLQISRSRRPAGARVRAACRLKRNQERDLSALYHQQVGLMLKPMNYRELLFEEWKRKVVRQMCILMIRLGRLADQLLAYSTSQLGFRSPLRKAKTYIIETMTARLGRN